MGARAALRRRQCALFSVIATSVSLAGCAVEVPVRTASAPLTPSPMATAAPATTVAPTPPTTTLSRATTRPLTPRASAFETARRRPVPPTRTRTPVKPRAAPASPPTCAVPSGVRADQVVLVTSGGSTATIRACRRKGSRYVTALGPYAGHVGQNGVSSAKREGDLRTPAGVFALRDGFGTSADPGLRVGSWRRVDARDVWVDDPASALYNTHQRTPADGRWDSAEKLQVTPAYRYAQVIGYNESRTPSRGSAIFLHVDLGHGTAGCVSLPTTALLAVLRWEQAGAVMAIR